MFMAQTERASLGIATITASQRVRGKKRRLKSGGRAELRGREEAVNSGDVKKNAES